MEKFRRYALAKESGELKKLILENPDLPIVVLAGEEAYSGEHHWTYCSCISFFIEEMLDCDYLDDDDCVFVSRDDLEDHIVNVLYDDYCDKTDEEYEAAIKQKMAELEPYWVRVIAICATN